MRLPRPMEPQADNIDSIPADQRAVEFDFAVRAPLRTHVVKCINSGWTPEEIALALGELADELARPPGRIIARS